MVFNLDFLSKAAHIIVIFSLGFRIFLKYKKVVALGYANFLDCRAYFKKRVQNHKITIWIDVLSLTEVSHGF